MGGDNMKKTLSILMALLLLWSMALPAAAAETAAAATLRLEKAEGTVKVSNASGKSVTVTDGMRLYSGYTIATEKSSYAYVSLDSTKAVKLDASSKAEVRKSGKKLELNAVSGSLFFNVTAPVDKDESLNIRTSTMVTGVRGTSGWVVVIDRFTSRVHLLEGTLTVTSSEPATGQMRQATITSGQTATATLKGLAQAGRQMSLTVTNLQEKQVPGFVAVEVEKDPALQQKIAAKSRLSIPAIIGDAWARLENEQASANAADQNIQKDLNKIAAVGTNQVFTGQQEETGGSGGGSSGGSSNTPPVDPPVDPPEEPTNPTMTLDSPTAAELKAALETPGVTNVTVTKAGVNDLSTESYAVSGGQTLDIQSGTLTVGAGQTLTVASGGTFSNRGTTVVSGTATVSGSADNSGTITVTSLNSLHVEGSLTNTGDIRVGTAAQPGLLDISGTMSSSGSILIVGGSSKIVNSGTFTNSGAFGSDSDSGTVSGDGTFVTTGTYTDTRSDALYAMVQRSDGSVPYLGSAAFSPWISDTTVTLTGAANGTLSSSAVTASGAVLDLNGHTAVISAPLSIQGGLTIRDSAGGGVLSASSGAIEVAGGSLTLQSGTVSTQDGTAIAVSSGSAAISGGTVEVSAAQPTGYAVSGTFTFTGGILRAKDGAHVTDMKVPLPAISDSGDGWYTMDLSGEVVNSVTLDDPTAAELTEALNTYDSVIVTNGSKTNALSFSDDLPFTVPAGKELILRSGAIQVDGSNGFTVDGAMTAEAGTDLNGSGTLVNNGTLDLTDVVATCSLYNKGTLTLTDSSVTVASGYAITNYASTATIQGASTIRSNGSDAIYNQNGAVLYVDGGTVDAPKGYAIHNADSTYSGDRVKCYLGTAGKADVTITGLRGVWSEMSSQSVTIGKSGSGYTVTITGTDEGIHSKSAALTIHDGANISASAGDSIYSTGTLTMDGGTVSCAADRYNAIKAEGAVTISGGTVSATGTDTSGIYLDNGGSLLLSGGIVEATNEKAGCALDGTVGAGVTLTGGTVRAKVSSSLYNNDAIQLDTYAPMLKSDGWFVLTRVARTITELTKALADDKVTDVIFLGTELPGTGTVLAIPDGKTVIIAENVSLSVTGAINGPGTLINNGTLSLSDGGSLGSTLKLINNGTLNDRRTTGAAEVMVTAGDGTVAHLGALADMEWVNGGTVKLMNLSFSDVPPTLKSTIPAGYTVTLDLNGQAVTPDGGTLSIGSGASLKILNSNVTEVGIANGTLISSADAAGTILLEDNAWFGMNSGRIENTGTTGYAIVSQQSGAEIQLNGGTVSSQNNVAILISDGTLQLGTDAAVSCYNGNGIVADGSAAVTMLGGTVEGTGTDGIGISLNGDSTLDMQDGTVTGGISVNSTKPVTVSGGTISASSGDTLAVNAGAELTVTGGTVKNTGSGAAISAIGTVKLLGGTVTYTGTEPDAVIVNGSIAKLIVSSGSQINSRVNGVKLMSGTMEMTGGTVTANSIGVFVSDGCSLTMSGGNLESTGGSAIEIDSNATTASVTVTSGTVSSAGAMAISMSAGKLELGAGATVSGSSSGIYASGTADITMRGGTVEGTGASTSGVGMYLMGTSKLNMQDGAVTGITYGISVDPNAKATAIISGGTVTLTMDNPTNEYAVSGPFTFSGGTLRAKAPGCFFEKEYFAFLKDPIFDGEYYAIDNSMVSKLQ